MSILIIAEKPSAAQSIAAAIMKKPKKHEGFISEDNVMITWAVGHLLSLAEPEMYDQRYRRWDLSTLPIIPVTFKLIPNPKTKKQLQIIKELATRCSKIVNACDSGREGELIFGYIMQYLRIQKPVRRLWTSSLTPEAIREAYQNMKDGKEYDNLLKAAIARNESDWIIGINGTRAYSAKHKELLSVGRVQTPVLAMLAERQVEIENFKPETYFEVVAQFSQGATSYIGKWQGKRILQKETALQIANKVAGKDGAITSYQVNDKMESPPKLFDLTQLQKEANAKFGYTAQKTLNIAQALYEDHKAITYPRTNSSYVDVTVIPVMHKIFDRLLNSPYEEMVRNGDKSLVNNRNKNICRPDKIEDHHAILPTDKIPANLSRDENHIYQLIVKRFLAQFYPAAKYKIHTIITTVEQEKFKSTIKEEIQLGWKFVYRNEKNKESHEENDEQFTSSFMLNANQMVNCKKAIVAEKQTTPPKWYTEGTLVSAMQTAGKEIEDEELRDVMKDHGLGTPATRAGIIERLKKVGYIQSQGKKLVVTAKGFALIKIVQESGIGLLTSAELTGQWEKRLNEITRGEASSETFLKQIQQLASLIVERVKLQQPSNQLPIKQEQKSFGPCPIENCDGVIIESKKGYGCSNWKSGCQFVIWKVQYGKKLSEKNVKDLISRGKTQVLKFMSKNKKPYRAKLILIDKKTGATELEFENKQAHTQSDL